MTPTDSSTFRVSSYARTGGNREFNSLAPGETLDPASLEGSGFIRHGYFSILRGEHYLRDLVLRAY